MIQSLLKGPSGFTYPYTIEQSCRFDEASQTALYRTNQTPTNNKIWTFSTWLKPSLPSGFIASSYDGATDQSRISMDGDDKILVGDYTGSWNPFIPTLAVYRDVSSWYHILVVANSTEGTATDRMKIYVNGVLQDIDTGGLYNAVDLNHAFLFNTDTKTQHIGTIDIGAASGNFINGYFAETIFVDGQALTISDFGISQNGIWVPIEYVGTYGDNGFYLDYSNSSHFGEDQSGNNNDFTDSGLATNDQVEDSPTNNWCTLNPTVLASGSTYSNGNLVLDITVAGLVGGVSTMPLTSGKYYCEATITAIGAGLLIGLYPVSTKFDGTQIIYENPNTVSYQLRHLLSK